MKEFYIKTLASRDVDSLNSARFPRINPLRMISVRAAVSSDKQPGLSLYPQTLFLGVII